MLSLIKFISMRSDYSFYANKNHDINKMKNLYDLKHLFAI